ncbi:hypothetical protein ACHAXS_014289 [Conticribra weissflogii]
MKKLCVTEIISERAGNGECNRSATSFEMTKKKITFHSVSSGFMIDQLIRNWSLYQIALDSTLPMWVRTIHFITPTPTHKSQRH